MSNVQLQKVLQSSSLHSLLLVTTRALSRSGFGDVQVLDRRDTRQKSRHGGHELLCSFTLGQFPMRVIVKVINDSVRLRMLDELAGAVIRTGSDFGIIVSPHQLTASAAKYQASYKVARVEVIDGPALTSTLVRLGVGVQADGRIDHVFFANLERLGRKARAFIEKEMR